MAEGIFWIFLSFFSVLGLFSFVRILQNAFTARETQDTVVLIPVGSDAPSAELKIRAVMSDGWDSVLQNGEFAVVDVGMDAETRAVCDRLSEEYGLEILSVGEVCQRLHAVKELR